MKKSKEEVKQDAEAPVKVCDKNNPNDPHYGEAGDYNATCVWIADIGE